MSGITVRRPYEGQHEEQSDDCWCHPVVLTEDEVRGLSTEQILKLAKEMPN